VRLGNKLHIMPTLKIYGAVIPRHAILSDRGQSEFRNARSESRQRAGGLGIEFVREGGWGELIVFLRIAITVAPIASRIRYMRHYFVI